MRPLNIRLEELVEELLVVLEEDFCQMNLTLVRLDELREAVIRRDEDKLNGLLDMIKDEGVSYGQVEAKRYAIRTELADIFGCSVDQMNLSRLCENLPQDKMRLVKQKQTDLVGLIVKLKREHTSTGMLLKECSKFNNMLLKKIFGNGAETVTYDSRGTASWQPRNGMVNFKL